MKRFISICLFCFFCLNGWSLYAEERIISTAPSATEILFALGFGNQVVGVTDYCTYPLEATKKVHIGGNFNPDLERISTLRPTIVILLDTDHKIKQYCKKIGVKIVELNFDSISDIYTSIFKIGEALNVRCKAQHLILNIQHQLKKITSNKTNKKHPKVLLVVYREVNRLRDVWVAGPKSFLGEILDMCGAQNVFNDLNVPYARVSLEEILARNPDVIFEVTSLKVGNNPKRAWKLWSELGRLKAVEHNRVYVFNDPYMTIPGPRVVLIIETFMKYLYHIR